MHVCKIVVHFFSFFTSLVTSRKDDRTVSFLVRKGYQMALSVYYNVPLKNIKIVNKIIRKHKV